MKQRGYTLLVLLLSILGASAALLGSAPVFWQSHGTLNQREVLASAKLALVSYAVNYIDLYGPRGAGLGHFPCPDTDDATQSTTWRYDGPNPPCGSGVLAFGKLPRHLSTLRGRYSFHQQSSQQLLYAVSTKFVNNPVNRIVNPESKSDYQAFSDPQVIALIRYPDSGGDAGLFIAIKRSDVVIGMLRRAAIWAISKLPTEQQVIQYRQECLREVEFPILLWLGLDSHISNSCENHKQALLETGALLDGVPYRSHWFVRNQWHQFIDIEIMPSCINAVADHCEWKVELPKSNERVLIKRIAIADPANT